MSYSGYLIKVGDEIVPNDLIRYKTYKVTPNQRQDLDSHVMEDGYLRRNVLVHTRTKIEFNLKRIDNTQMNEVMSLIQRNMINALERKVELTYYDPETDQYNQGTFYVPDPNYTIYSLSRDKIQYEETRIAFIEY